MEVRLGLKWSESKNETIYRRSEYSLDSIPKPSGGSATCLINDIQLELDDTGIVLFLWGLFPPPEKCQSTVFEPLKVERRAIAIGNEIEWSSGIAKRYNDSPWSFFFDSRNGWLGVCSELPSQRTDFVEFIPRCIATFNAAKLTGIWIQPIFH